MGLWQEMQEKMASLLIYNSEIVGIRSMELDLLYGLQLRPLASFVFIAAQFSFF
jgi:hypothetical protein